MANITYTDKTTGDTFTAADANEIKSAVNSKVEFIPGDILITGDTDKTTPVWVDAEGQLLDLGVYPDLDLLFAGSSGMDVPNKLTDPSDLPASHGYGVAFSSDETYLAVAYFITPFITIYKRSGDTFTKLTDPAALPASTGRGTAFSADGVCLAVAHSTTPFVTIYKRSGDTFTKLTDPAALPASTGRGTAFSSDGTYLAVAHDTSPFITIYKGEEALLLPDLTPTDTRLKAKIYTGETA